MHRNSLLLLPLALFATGAFQTLAAETATPPPGTYTTSWMGNSYMSVSGEQWQMAPEIGSDVAVAPDGTVFTSGYHETHGGAASFRGDTGAFAGRYAGFGTGFGDPSSAIAADDTYAYFGTVDGLRRCPHGGGRPNASALNGASPRHAILGVALKNGKLFVSDYSYNRIRVLDAATMVEQRSWEMQRPIKIAVDNDMRIWVTQESAGGIQPPDQGPMYHAGPILSFSSDGIPGASITDFDNPQALEVNPATNQLYVGGLNQHCQIWRYDQLSSTPRKVGTFGVLNGIFSGTPGEFTQTAKLHWIRGIDVDAAGNLYVSCCYGTFWGQAIEKFSPAGALVWRVLCATSLDMGGVDPGDEQDVYTKFHHYRMNWNAKAPGSEWSLKGFTVNRFKYPGDPRADSQTDVGSRSIGYGAVRIQGRPFMIRSDQSGYRFEMFRFNPATDGEVAIPSVIMGAGSSHVIKRDTNGDGRFDADESYPGYRDYNQYWEIAPSGDIYTLADDLRYGTVVKYPFQGFDRVGNPIYAGASAVPVKVPDAFRNAYQGRGLAYDEANDSMYLLGSVIADDDDAVTRVACFAKWSTSARKLAWESALPRNDPDYTGVGHYGGGTALSLRQAGDHLFLAYGVGHVRILKKTDGTLVGTLTQNVNGWKGGDGQVDSAYGLSAYKRKNGEYILMIENAGWGNITMYRWMPTAAIKR